MNDTTKMTWKFQRIGGLEQVSLRNADEIAHLDQLDPKLWVALSCPASGLEFDARTLQLIDADGDGRIRIPEVLAAVRWVCSLLTDPACIVEPEAELPLDAINTDSPEGSRMAATCRAILENLDKGEAASLSQEDVTKAAASAAKNLYNGDGILPPLPDFGEDIASFIEDALSVVGGVRDASGLPGINMEIAAAFMQSLKERRDWQERVSAASEPLGADSAEAWALLQKLGDKINDYFLRCELAAFAPDSTKSLNASGGVDVDGCLSIPTVHGLIDPKLLEELPLSRIEADRPLHIASGLNPAWRQPVQRFFSLIGPLLEPAEDQEAKSGDEAATAASGLSARGQKASGGCATLSVEDWRRVQNAFAPYAEALAKKPPVAAATVNIPPDPASGGKLDSMKSERVRELLQSDILDRFAALAQKDASVPAASADIAAAERLTLYYLHLHRLLMNFVSFYDFYSMRRSAAFQAGTLYLDSRSCRLCLPVADLARHASLAAYSELCLVYCECRKAHSTPGGAPGEGERDSMTIVAAMTAGEADMLMEGRNGVFVDNTGQDWDATVVKIISNPISLREALWQPYRKFGRMVTEQVGKFAGAKQAELSESAAKKAQSAVSGVLAQPAQKSGQSAAPFDIGRSVGIFAAIGLALGAIGTALASIANALFSLSWWQFPLIFVGLFMLVSGPSLVLAWLKLRKRTLSPLLEASGWAVNGRVPINFTLGRRLTSLAALPPNAQRSFNDPLRKPRRWHIAALALTLILALAAGWIWIAEPPFVQPVKRFIHERFTPDKAKPAAGAKASGAQGAASAK
ncbi:ABC transporter permease [Desulfovibrio sp. OttesenSCG-928-A18]|nr:ABC transporter permease [Desulfovibrio sp. OttesenSCG-928-A18]